jgi:hypothetical protein
MPKELFTLVYYDHDDSWDHYTGSASQVVAFIKRKGIQPAPDETLIVRGSPINYQTFLRELKK